MIDSTPTLSGQISRGGSLTFLSMIHSFCDVRYNVVISGYENEKTSKTQNYIDSKVWTRASSSA